MKKLITIFVCCMVFCIAKAQSGSITNEMIKIKSKQIIKLMEQKIPIHEGLTGLKERYYQKDYFEIQPSISVLYVSGRTDIRMRYTNLYLMDIGADGLGENLPKNISDSLISIATQLEYDRGAEDVYFSNSKPTSVDDKETYYEALLYFEERLKKM